MITSDPYVVLKLGKQTVKTSVINSNLNPVWNQVLILSVPADFGPLGLKVFDQDMFSSDDYMGEAEVDLQPLIASAMAFGDAGVLEDMQIGKWLQTHDNALKEDSTVNIIDGRVKQKVSLVLQNVECGEIDLELEWIPL
ncbi:putative ADP-ribosylation factor GTPase-activating protein agd13 [Stylosanthes scabra]|uniref:ADP-ribosylation factor GTPase-activating protein agd13 n=1 Tax=Stylosanthes scabra TaxID=79078 RepID=A0ABU6RIJ4_9FABA|nr:putative ADP-ribosylation factor GTPase-activating protein agd13 [Stylosanthes scabra]